MINKDKAELILTLSCPDTFGIVAEVASFMSEQGLTIKESKQFGDSETDTFFMRVKALSINSGHEIDVTKIKNLFNIIAIKRNMTFNIYSTAETPKIIIMVSKFDHCLMDLYWSQKFQYNR